MPFDVGPLRYQDAVHHTVSGRPIPARLMVANHAVLFCAEGFDRFLGGEVEVVGPQTDDLATERLERVREQEELARTIDVASLPFRAVPRVPDFDPVDVAHDVVIARRSGDRPARQIPHRPREHLPRFLTRERIRDVGSSRFGCWHRSVPELPESAIAGSRRETVPMIATQWLESDAVALECDWKWCDHKASCGLTPAAIRG
jgi:hypothetical protein